MSTVKVHDKQFEVYLSEAVILERVKALAEQISQDYAGKKPLFIAILYGSFMFASDLFKQLHIEAELCCIVNRKPVSDAPETYHSTQQAPASFCTAAFYFQH